MIDAKTARALSDNIDSEEAKKQIARVDVLINSAAIDGRQSIDITKEPVSLCVEQYLRVQGYTIEIVRDDQYHTIVSFKISW